MKKIFLLSLFALSLPFVPLFAYYSNYSYQNPNSVTATGSYTVGCMTYYYDTRTGTSLYTKNICTQNYGSYSNYSNSYYSNNSYQNYYPQTYYGTQYGYNSNYGNYYNQATALPATTYDYSNYYSYPYQSNYSNSYTYGYSYPAYSSYYGQSYSQNNTCSYYYDTYGTLRSSCGY